MKKTTIWQLRVIYVYYYDDVAYCVTVAAGDTARCFAWGRRRESRLWRHCSSSIHQHNHHHTIYVQYLALFRWNWMKNGRTWLRRRVLNGTPTCRSSADARATAYTPPLADVCSMTIRFETLSLLNDVRRRWVLHANKQKQIYWEFSDNFSFCSLSPFSIINESPASSSIGNLPYNADPALWRCSPLTSSPSKY